MYSTAFVHCIDDDFEMYCETKYANLIRCSDHGFALKDWVNLAHF